MGHKYEQKRASSCGCHANRKHLKELMKAAVGTRWIESLDKPEIQPPGHERQDNDQRT
jgi:hypothetical protein